MENFWKYLWQGLNTVGIILAFTFMNIVYDSNNSAEIKAKELEKQVQFLEKQVEFQNEQIQYLKEISYDTDTRRKKSTSLR